MTGRQKFILSILSIFGIFLVIQVINLFHHQTVERSVDSLINQYYQLNKKSPESAKRALDLILEKDPNNQQALTALSYWYLAQGDTYHALQKLKMLHERHPKDRQIEQQLNDLMMLSQSLNASKKLTTDIPIKNILMTKTEKSASDSNETNPQEKKSLKPLVATSGYPQKTAPTTVSDRNQLLNIFYQNKKTDPQKAWQALHRLLKKYPDDVMALKEAGYFALSENKKDESVMYFKHAYDLSHDPMLAMQIGYLLDGLHKKREAYHYFDLATKNPNQEERLKAEIAKTNLRGIQTQFLPYPFFANIQFYPFYRSRFKLMIYPLIAKVGVVLNQEYHFLAYLSYRRTSDNRSSNNNNLPQIFEDDAAITSLGLQITPIPRIPLSAFIEAGKAVDLVYRNRGRWRNDFRTGIFYYNEWGKEARYTLKPTFSFIPNMDLYGDAIYFSRFLNDIATLRARPGFEVFRYGSSAFTVYMKGFISQDTSREFYNNFIEYGPSIAFTPSDRYNVSIRYENLHGIYLPAGGATVNPYSRNYHNNIILLDAYIGL